MESSPKPKFFRLATLKGQNDDVSSKTLTKNKGTFKSLRDFFQKLQKGLKSQGSSRQELESVISLEEAWNFAAFFNKIKEFTKKISESEAEMVFSVVSSDGVLDKEEFFKELRKKYEESESSESEDISSASEAEYVYEEVDLGKIAEIFEMILFRFTSQKVSAEAFEETASKHFGMFVTSADLNKFLLSKDLRIEDGPERNMLISYILEEKTRVPLNRLLRTFSENCFATEIKETPTNLLEVEKISIVNACKKIDIRKSGYVHWKQLEAVLTALNIEISRDFKYFCYSLEKSLDMIPYSLI
jgi:hypothetical protein